MQNKMGGCFSIDPENNQEAKWGNSDDVF